jgi:hypothetical protein
MSQNLVMNEDMNAKLLSIRRYIINKTKETFKDADKDDKELIKSILSEMVKPIDQTVGGHLTSALTGHFGDHKFNVEMIGYVKPFVKVDANNPYRYVVNKISWNDGPSVMQVHFYIKDKYSLYMKDTEFSPKIYDRQVKGIEKRIQSVYKPLNVANKEFAGIQVFISQIVYRENDKVTDVKFYIQPTDKKLFYVDTNNKSVNALDTVEAPTLGGALSMLQSSIENCYYSPPYSPKFKVISKKIIKSEENPDFSGESVGDDDSESFVESDDPVDDVTTEEEQEQVEAAILASAADNNKT